MNTSSFSVGSSSYPSFLGGWLMIPTILKQKESETESTLGS